MNFIVLVTIIIIETLTFSNYEIRETKISQIDTDVTIEETVGFKCPKCKTKLKMLEHGETIKCHRCKLEMTRWGNALVCKMLKEK